MEEIYVIKQKDYEEAFSKNESAKMLKEVAVFYRVSKLSGGDMTKLETIRENFYGISPHANIDLQLLSQLKCPVGKVLFKEENNMFCMYGENSFYIEGGFIENNVFRIMNIDVFYKWRNEGCGTTTLTLFLHEIESRFNVYCFDVLAQNQYAPEKQMEAHTIRLEKFYEKLGFEKSKFGDMLKKVDDKNIDMDIVEASLKDYYTKTYTKMIKPKGGKW